MLTITPIDTPTLGDRNYLAHDGHVAVVVDPQRDIDRVLALAATAGVRITHVFETHIHNDYVTGGHVLAAATGAAYHVNAADEVTFDRVPVRDLDGFVDELLAGLDAWPAYYAHMAAANSDGPTPSTLDLPERADPASIRARLAAGEWVVDQRHRVAFAAGQVAGTLNIGLDGSFATYLGWLIPHGTPLTLLANTPEEVLKARRELSRIGIDPAAHATGGPDVWSGGTSLRSYPRASFTDLAQVRHHGPVVVLDVRRNLEHADSHLDRVTHIPLHELAARLDEIPDGEIWVHCAAGYRASIAASILAAAGRRVVHIDDDYTNARPAATAIGALTA